MLVKDWMSKNVHTVDAKDALQKAVNVMKEHNVRLLPVMREGKLVGVISDRDVKRPSTADAAYMEVQDVLYRSYKLKVEEVMRPDPVTVPDDFTVAEAADVLLQHKFSGLPVVDRKGQLVGIITQTDMFKVIVSMSGMAGRGIQFGFHLKDRSGSITRRVPSTARRWPVKSTPSASRSPTCTARCRAGSMRSRAASARSMPT